MFSVLFFESCCLFLLLIKDIYSHVYSKQQHKIQVKKFSMSREKQFKTIRMDENNVKLRANFCVEAMNSKQQVKAKLGHVVQIHVCR